MPVVFRRIAPLTVTGPGTTDFGLLCPSSMGSLHCSCSLLPFLTRLFVTPDVSNRVYLQVLLNPPFQVQFTLRPLLHRRIGQCKMSVSNKTVLKMSVSNKTDLVNFKSLDTNFFWYCLFKENLRPVLIFYLFLKLLFSFL